MKLKLEYRDEFEGDDTPFKVGGLIIMMTPSVGEDYWMFRVKLFKDQAIIAFPKFGQIGIGFAVEGENWNTNLPSTCETEYIYNHIKKCKKYSEITKAECIEAISILQKAAKYVLDGREKDEGNAPIDKPTNLMERERLIDHFQKLHELSKKGSK